MIRCSSQKKVYQTQEMAEEALIDARTRYEYSTGQGPINVYKCDDCGYFHLTSKGPMNSRLDEMMKAGTLNRMKEANRWESRLKNRRRN